MKDQTDIIGKTISGIVAVPTQDNGPVKIWMMQFTDGTHVEFVSPGARRALDRFAGTGRKRRRRAPQHPQLALNVA